MKTHDLAPRYHRMNTLWSILALSFVLAFRITAEAATATNAVPAANAERLQWWREARFGLFIHWGPVSLKGTEIGWSRGGERRGYGSTGTEVPVAVYDNFSRNSTRQTSTPGGGRRREGCQQWAWKPDTR